MTWATPSEAGSRYALTRSTRVSHKTTRSPSLPPPIKTASANNCATGIHYRRLGLRIPGSGLSPHLSFLGCLPYAVKTTPHDLVVEEFTPPTGFCMLPWWTRKPVVSMVQWFFFRDWERRYKLPFERMMRGLGKRADYRHFIVQTDRMGDYFRELMPDVHIWKVPCGIGAEAFHVAQDDGAYALYLGRLDLGHKGLDYLIDAWRRLAAAGTRIPLKIAGAGPAEDWLRGQIMQLPPARTASSWSAVSKGRTRRRCCAIAASWSCPRARKPLV